MHYRLRPQSGARGKWVNRKELETAIVAKIRDDIGNDAFIEKLTEATRKWYPEHDPGQDLAKEAQKLERRPRCQARTGNLGASAIHRSNGVETKAGGSGAPAG